MNEILLILMSLILEEANKQQASVGKRLIQKIVIYVRIVKRNRINAKDWFNNSH